ncbi:MAG TPA: PilZ domain-containing protein [Sphingomicrobium sp.]|nr:PilZ domain-containing protein [Sphingomicrobium sp.]
MSTNLASCIDNGREARVTLNCDAVLTESDGCTLDVVIVDVSKGGFRLQSLAELEVGSDVLLHVHKLAPVRGQIRWTCGQEAGGVFLDPVSL